MHDDVPLDQQEEEQRERYRELLEELRTVMPGTQVLFAFLLTAAFSQRFTDLDLLGRRVYAAALLLAAVASITLMTPAAFHRMAEGGNRRERLIASIRLQVTGMTLLLASMALVTFVVSRFIFDDAVVGAVFGLVTAGAGVALWYVLPRTRRLNRLD